MTGGAPRRRLALAFVTVLVSCGGDTPPPSGTPMPSPSAAALTESGTSVSVAPAAVLLTEASQTAQLSAEASDGDGSELSVTWWSSDPETVSVDEGGLVTAVVGVGSAVVYAEAGDEWVSVPVVVARPADGAVLVADDEILDAPVPVDPDAGPWAGTRMRTTLAIAEAPDAGTVILAREGAALAGRVVTATAAADGSVAVEYELVPLPELFEAADISLDLPIDLRDVEVADAAEASFRRFTDGSARLRVENDRRTASIVGHDVEQEFKRGPLTCKLDAAAKFSVTDFDIRLSGQPRFEFAFDYERARDGDTPRHAKVALVGPLTYDITGGVKAQAGFQGTAECEVVLPIWVPAPGLLAVVLGFAIPVGIGVTADGSIKAVEVELGPRGTVGAQLGIGVECQSGTCIGMSEVAPVTELRLVSTAKFLPDMRVGLGVSVHGIVGLDAVLTRRRFSMLDVRIGPKQALDLAFDEAQARDAAYASNYDLRLVTRVSPGADLRTGIQLIVGRAWDLTYTSTPDRPLSQSPVGILTAEKARVQVGKAVRLSIDLDPKSIEYFPIGPNVAEVTIARRLPSGGLKNLQTIPLTSSRQAHFEWTWEPGREYLGMNELVAFVTTKALPGVRLEITGDSTAFVEVVDACLADLPAPAPSQQASPRAGSTPRPPAPTPTDAPVDPCQAELTITYAATSHLHASEWTITGSVEKPSDVSTLPPEQPVDEYVGTGTYTGRAVDGLTMALTYVDPPACERDSLWLAGEGEVWLTAFRFDDGWFGAPFEGPAMVISVLQKTEPKEGELAPDYIDLLALAVPLDGGTATYPLVVMPEAECGDEWARTITVTYAPRDEP